MLSGISYVIIGSLPPFFINAVISAPILSTAVSCSPLATGISPTTSSLAAPVEENQKVGEAMYTVDGKETARVDIVSAETVERAGLDTVARRLIHRWVRYSVTD